MQDSERDGELVIIVLDETYGGDETTYERDSAKHRLRLEDQFKVQFEEVNVGPGFDIPAFLTILTTASVPLWATLLGAFFLGKPINENLGAWREIGTKIRTFFSRPVILARHGAAVIAIEKVFDEMGGLPKSLRLLSYGATHIGEDSKSSKSKKSVHIDPTPETINLGVIRHIFEIEADGTRFRVWVDGMSAKLVQIE
jgi:hypothetical protein